MSVTDRISTLIDWAISNGATLHPSVEVFQDARTGLSFRVKPDASSPVQAHEPIVQVPSSLTLSYLDAVADDAFSADVLAATAPHVIGRLFLAKEYLQGEESFWYPYIQALPQPTDRQEWALPPFWDTTDAELLEGTNVEVGLSKIRDDVRRDLEALGEHVIPPELYHWAYCIFSSRSFRPSLVLPGPHELPTGVAMDDFSVLLPLLDVGNHDMTAEVRWELDCKGKHCALSVGRAHQPGEQVFNNYSMKTNAELFLGYGFMVPATEGLHNDYTHVRKRTVPADEYLISLRPLRHPSSVLARHRQTLHLAPTTAVLPSFQHLQPEMVWDIFCTIAPSTEQRAQLIPVPETQEQQKDEDYQMDRFISGQVEGEARAYLQQTVAIVQHKVLQELERLNETDVEVVGGDEDGLSGNQKLALDYRERCRMVLEAVLETMGADDVFDEE